MMHAYEPAYLELYRQGELARRAEFACAALSACMFCARRCGVDRTRSDDGAGCRTGRYAVISSFGAHHGEEHPLRGERGSGTVFFARCNLRCVYCQNADISWGSEGRETAPEALAAMMLALQDQGCHNINLVSPSHVVPQILEALVIAAGEGLRLPLVYNTGGYDALETLRLLDGVIDIYLPDMKYADDVQARKYSGVGDYVAVNRIAVSEMHRQVGDLRLDSRGVAIRGLLVRHLVMPKGIAGTAEVMRFIAEKLSRNTYVNIMEQYRPCYRATEFPQLTRRPGVEELVEARRAARSLGLHRLDGR